MMWRVLTMLDFVTTLEVHFGIAVPSAGVSMGTHAAMGVLFGTWKYSPQCLLGPIPVNAPPVLGHDAGILRPHILIDPTPVPPAPPPPPLAASAITSALATACSALKPCMSSSRDLRDCGGPLPVCTEVIPYVGITMSGNVPCGFSGPHMGPPLVPTQLQDWSGLTVGDLVGGFANMAAEWAFQAAIESTAIGLGKLNKLGGTLAKTIGAEILNNTVAFIFAYVVPNVTPSDAPNIGLGITQFFQQGVDGALQDQGINPDLGAISPFGPAIP